jgi:formyltetrahydrofolate deformylase
MNKSTILVQCQDRKGLIATICNIFLESNLNIHHLKEFVEEETNTFFMRAVVMGDYDVQKIYSQLFDQLPVDATVYINPKEKKDIVILATKEYHCLSDLLARHHFGEIQANIKAVFCNHPHLEEYVNRFNIPYHHISCEHVTKDEFEDTLLKEISVYKPDYLVLAKFMRILSPNFVSKYENKIINIHHSFLPAFIGANPYRQAFERGVKLIGATAHIVNNNLDEGPIIVQNVISVDHSFTVQKLVKTGHELEKNVLTKGCELVFEDRVFVSGNKTIIFE